MDEKHGLHEGNKDIDLDGGEIYGLDEGKWQDWNEEFDEGR